MAYPILLTPPYNLANTQKTSINPLITSNNNATKQITKDKIGYVIEGRKNPSNRNINILSTNPSNYCNEKCLRCGRDICICKCL